MHEYGNETLTEISYLVLLALYQPNHGYGIMQFLNTHTEGRVKADSAAGDSEVKRKLFVRRNDSKENHRGRCKIWEGWYLINSL